MAEAGDVIENPVIADWVVFLESTGVTLAAARCCSSVSSRPVPLSPSMSTHVMGSATRSSRGRYGATRGCAELCWMPSLLVEDLKRGA